jgi:cytochrome c5
MEGKMNMSMIKRMTNLAPALAIGILSLTSVHSWSQSSAHPVASKPAATKQVAAPAKEEEGSRIFEQNCARCHNAPDGFSPHISGTVVRHMRVRASLSKHDEEELLRFLNP